MSKKTGRDAVVLAFSDAYAQAENTKSKIAQVCTIARQTYSGKDVPEDDVEYIVGKLAKVRGWTGSTAKVRKSEARKVLSVYAVLPEAIEHVRSKRGSCDWRAGMRLATCLKKSDGKLKPALAAFESQGESSKVTPQGRVA